MTGYLRNPEVQRSLLLFLGMTVIGSAVGFFIGTACGVLVLVLGIVYTGAHLLVTLKRYRRIAQLSAELDRILHGKGSEGLSACTEGELSVLHSEIYKMTVRLRETAENLTTEKSRLADSLADISHQLRTPLTSMHLLLTMLGDTGLEETRRAELLGELHSMLSRIDWLVNALLKLSKLDAETVQLRRDTLPLAELLDQSCGPLRLPMELREQTLTIEATGELCGDAAWTAEALGNILKNCMEHTPAGGTITIRAAENPLYVEIVISDTGTGISEKDLPHIFERFYKGQDAGAGSFGIGLALARTIITSQNGTLKAGNLPDGGAVFTARFYKGTV